MRKGLILLSVFVLLVGVYGLSWAAGIRYSKHDFGTNLSTGSAAVGYNGDPTGQICRGCHIPHKSLTKTAMSGAEETWQSKLLWRQTLVSIGDGWTLWSTADYWYTGWRNTTNSPTLISDLDSASKACLGCHDGQPFYLWATWSGYTTASAVNIVRTGAQKIDLRNDHPVGIKYDPTYATSGELKSQSTAEGSGIVFADGASVKVGCGSCHDPHNKAGEANFVRLSMSASSLCLACHTK